MSSVAKSNHKTFLAALGASHSPVWKIAFWLVGRGHEVKVNPSAQAETHDEWKKNADNGDLELSLPIEVKQVNLNFTCANDWPTEKFIVGEKEAFDQAFPKPYGYIYMNKAGTHVAMVMSTSVRERYVEKRTDRRFSKVEQEFYFVPLSEVSFAELPDDVTPTSLNTQPARTIGSGSSKSPVGALTAMSSGAKSEHEASLARRDSRKSPVWRIASWMVGRGHAVKVSGGRLEISLRIEVKQLSANFTCANDWPFGQQFIVCAKHAFDQAVPKPYGFIYLNCAGTHVAMVTSTSVHKWYVAKRNDRRYHKVAQMFYFAPMDEVSFARLPTD